MSEAFDCEAEAEITNGIELICKTLSIEIPDRVEGKSERFHQLRTLNKINQMAGPMIEHDKYKAMANGAASAWSELKRTGLAQDGSRPVVKSLVEKMLSQAGQSLQEISKG